MEHQNSQPVRELPSATTLSAGGFEFFSQLSQRGTHIVKMREYTRLEDAFTAWPCNLSQFGASSVSVPEIPNRLLQGPGNAQPLSVTLANMSLDNCIYINGLNYTVSWNDQPLSAQRQNFTIKNTLETELMLAYSSYNMAYAGSTTAVNRGPLNSLRNAMPVLWQNVDTMDQRVPPWYLVYRWMFTSLPINSQYVIYRLDDFVAGIRDGTITGVNVPHAVMVDLSGIAVANVYKAALLSHVGGLHYIVDISNTYTVAAAYTPAIIPQLDPDVARMLDASLIDEDKRSGLFWSLKPIFQMVADASPAVGAVRMICPMYDWRSHLLTMFSQQRTCQPFFSAPNFQQVASSYRILRHMHYQLAAALKGVYSTNNVIDMRGATAYADCNWGANLIGGISHNIATLYFIPWELARICGWKIPIDECVPDVTNREGYICKKRGVMFPRSVVSSTNNRLMYYGCPIARFGPSNLLCSYAAAVYLPMMRWADAQPMTLQNNNCYDLHYNDNPLGNEACPYDEFFRE